jgi:glycosyltransferase involved in cell wall biosynthesis
VTLNTNIKVSVITVSLNAALQLPKTIRSVLDQTYQQVEYIIIDGASKDNTVELVSSFGPCIDKFISEPDKGLYDAMNKGINAATGDLVIFLNAGDYFVTRDVLDFTLSKMNLKDADLFFGRIVWNDPRTKDIVLSDHSWCNFTWDLKASNFPHPATLYKKELFEKIGLFNLDFPIAADYEWNVRALVSQRTKFQYINIIVTVFFSDGLSNSPIFASQFKEEIDYIDQIFYKPKFIHKLFEMRNPFFLRKSLEKVLAKVFKTRLSRVYY